MDIREQAAAVTLPAVTLVNIDKLMKTTNSIIGQMQNELMPLVNELGGGGNKEVSKLLENAAGCLLALASSVSGQALVGSYIKE